MSDSLNTHGADTEPSPPSRVPADQGAGNKGGEQGKDLSTGSPIHPPSSTSTREATSQPAGASRDMTAPMDGWRSHDEIQADLATEEGRGSATREAVSDDPLEIRRLEVKAVVLYVGNDNDQLDGCGWVCEVGLADSEPEVQGWGPDPLAAALQAAENAHAQMLSALGFTVTGADCHGQSLLTWTERPPLVRPVVAAVPEGKP